jgi:hypothetical protein
MVLMDSKPTIDRAISIKENLDFILVHFANPLFPRTIMTRALGYQKEVFNAEEALTYFRASNYEDCRINAYSAFTDYQGINFTAPSFIMIDLDLKDFESQEMLDKILRKTLKKINKVFHGAQPTVLWTGGGYHIYQPISGFVLEEIDRFACFKDPSKKDLTSRFMQFAENCFTDKKSDSQHRPSVKSCLIRIPGTVNSKHDQEVRIVQTWDGLRAPIQYLLMGYRTWLVAGKINDKREEKRSCSSSFGYVKTDTIPWIEKLLTISLPDCRKYCTWRILAPYLINVRKHSDEEASYIIKEWLKRCNLIKRVSFEASSRIKYDIQNARRRGFYPISWNQLRTENVALYGFIDR